MRPCGWTKEDRRTEWGDSLVMRKFTFRAFPLARECPEKSKCSLVLRPSVWYMHVREEDLVDIVHNPTIG